MRAYVCGQCHVEYYFKGPEKRLVFPWAKGLKVEQIQAYYDEIKFRDWTHRDTGAPALKAQHPGVRDVEPGHSRPRRRHVRRLPHAEDHHKGATLSDHWVRSPVLNIRDACLGCHKNHDAKITENELRRASSRYRTVTGTCGSRQWARLMGLIADLKAAKEAGASDADLAHGPLSAAPRAVLSRFRRS